MKNSILNFSLCILALIIVGAACNAFTKGKESAEKAVAKFHERLNEEKYDEIYVDSADAFKGATTSDDARQLFETVKRKLGKVKSTQATFFRANVTTEGSFVYMDFETDFEQDKGQENFVFVVNGDEAKIAGYHINSKAFLK